jgi:prolyl 4-hydroxylase
MYAGDLDLACPLIWTLEGVLSPGECAALVARINAIGPAPAPITTAEGFVMRPDIRNNTRVIFNDEDLAEDLFRRVRPALPALMRGMALAGANERFRCYRYEPGQRFAMHYDGSFVRGERERSLVTFMIYLNDGFTGGATRFPVNNRSVEPRPGMALFFQHHLLHEGCPVESGVKYVLRSDIMYSRGE